MGAGAAREKRRRILGTVKVKTWKRDDYVAPSSHISIFVQPLSVMVLLLAALLRAHH